MSESTRCPEIEVLEKYVDGQLSEREAVAFKSHLELCGLCSLLIERLKDFDAQASEISPGPEPDWGTMQTRLEEECEKAAPPARKPEGWLSGRFWIAALGYGLAVILVYPAWLGITRKRVPAAPPASKPEVHAIAASGASLVDLNTTRDDRGLPAVTERAGERAAILAFFVPALPGTRHEAAIRDGSNRVALDLGEIRSFDGRGNFCVVVDPRSLPPGQYRLTVKQGVGSTESETSFEFLRR
jgi:hypothetical protein